MSELAVQSEQKWQDWFSVGAEILRLKNDPDQLDDLMHWLRADPHVLALEAWALPVLPRQPEDDTVAND